MSYEVLFAEKALSRIPDGLPKEVLLGLDQAMRRLGDDPLKYGQRSVFPYPARGQMYHFYVDHDGRRHFFTAHFYFTVDECAIKVFDVAYAV